MSPIKKETNHSSNEHHENLPYLLERSIHIHFSDDDDEDIPCPTEDPLGISCDDSYVSDSGNNVIRHMSDPGENYLIPGIREEQDEMEMLINELEFDEKPEIHVGGLSGHQEISGFLNKSSSVDKYTQIHSSWHNFYCA